MSSSIGDSAHAALNRAETDLKDDYRAGVRAATKFARTYRDDYRQATGYYDRKKSKRASQRTDKSRK